MKVSLPFSFFKLDFLFHCQMCFVLGVCCASPVPFRKDHLNNCVRACLSTRTENGEVDWSSSPLKLPGMDDADVPLSF